MARVLTSPELAHLRSEGQVSKLYLAILTPDVVYTARVNGVPTSNDELATIAYDGGAGTPADTRAHMSVYVGSEAGAYDKGSVRLREAISAASGTMKLGEMSDVDWADDDYLTIVREWLLRPRHLRIDSAGVVYMDYDITFGTPTYNPHTYPAPVPVIGPHAVAWLAFGTADVLFDASESYTVGGAGAMTYAWSVEPSGTASWDDDTSATPTLTVTAADTYTVECVVTWTYSAGSQAVSTSTYRHVFAFDENNAPMEVFKLRNCAGVFGSGGWSFNVTAYDDATTSEIRDRTLCVLFAVDRYGSDTTSIGPLLAGATPIRENVIAWGWITGESIEWNPEQGTVGFEVQGPHHWLNLVEGFPQGIEDTTDASSVWTNYNGLTSRAGTAMFWLWRSTGPQVMDAFIFPDSVIASGASPTALSEGSEREFSIYDAPPMKLWKQISTVVYNAVRAHCVCDRYGRLFIQRNLNEILDADRTGANAPTVMDLTKVDWRDSNSINRETISRVSQLDMSGVAYKAGANAVLFSLSPGHIFKLYGDPKRIEGLTLWIGSNSQTLSNAYCGLLLGNMNNEYPVLSSLLAANNRAFDIAPWQYATQTVAEADTERGISGTFTLLPRRISLSHNPTTGVLLTDVEWEAESAPVDGITGDPPPTPPGVSTTPTPVPPTPIEPVPEIPEALSCIMADRDFVVVTFNFEDASPTWYNADPNGDMPSGDFINCMAFENHAYVVEDNGSVWYTDNILGAIDETITWTEELSGYSAGDLECLQIVDDKPFILIHDLPARAWGKAWGALVELFPWSLPIVSGNEDCDTLPPPGTCVSAKSSGAGYRKVTPDALVAGSATLGTNYAATYEMFELDELPDPVCNCLYGLYVSRSVSGFASISDSGRYLLDPSGELRDGNTGTRGKNGTWPSTILETGITDRYGVQEDQDGLYYYIKSGSLWRNGAEFANYDLFSAGGGDRTGGLFSFPDKDTIVWQINRSDGASTTTHNIILLYDKPSATWSGKNGNLSTVIGSSWNRARGFWVFGVPEDDIP